MDGWNAKDYNKNSANQYRWGVELVNSAKIIKGENVLDIGCGDGKITDFISKITKLARTTGIDSSEKMIKFANENFSKRCNFIAINAENIDFENCFDLVFSNACLHWIHDQKKVLKGVYKSLKSGGRIFFQMGGKGNAGVMNAIVDSMTRSAKWKKYFKNFTKPYNFLSDIEYKKFLTGVGFVKVKAKLIPKTAWHDGKPGLESWMRTTWHPYTGRIPLKYRAKFIFQAIDSYLKATDQENETAIEMKMIRLEVRAEKPLK
jgi:trans-aconitate methyltransferase